MKTYTEFKESLSLAKNIGGRVLGKTAAGRFVRSFALPDKVADIGVPFTKYKLGKNKVTQALNPIYKSATDAVGTGPAAPLVFGTSLATRVLSPAGKKLDKARTDTRKNIVKGLEKSGDKNSQFNADRYMSNFKGVNNKPLYPSPIPKV